jgi:hypothetical protein
MLIDKIVFAAGLIGMLGLGITVVLWSSFGGKNKDS